MDPPTTVLALSQGTGGSFFGELLSGLTRELAAVGGRVVVVQTLGPGSYTDDLVPWPDFSTPAAWAEVDGAVAITIAVQGSYLQGLRDAGKPVVVACARIDGFDAPRAVPDNHDGTVAAVEHLIAHGHTRIGFVTNRDLTDAGERLAAYRGALKAHGLGADPTLVFTALDNSENGGARAARAVLAASRPPSALMVATDRTAIGLMRALTDAGLAIPRDIAVMSFDNIEAGSFSTPTLSSVKQRFDEVGALAGRLVLAQIRGEAVPFAPHSSPAAGLALRASCGCAPDVTGGRPPGPAMQVPSGSRLAAREQLGELLRDALLTDDDNAGGPTDDAILAMAVEVSDLLDTDDTVLADRMEALTASLHRIAPDANVLHRTVGALTDYLQRTGTSTALTLDGPTTAAAHVAAALWQMQARSFRGQSTSFEAALDEQVAVDRGLLDAGTSDPRLLRWLAGTHVRAGVLGLWEGDPSCGRLTVTGSYDPEGMLPDLVGTATTVEHFPPTPLIATARHQNRELCIVVPVRTKERDWGLLAVVGEANTMSARETYHHWAALLSASLESERLQTMVRESEERYALAARAANDGQWEWNARTQALHLSDRSYTLLGLESGPRANRLAEWRTVIHPDDLAVMKRSLKKAADHPQETVDSEFRIRTADGSYRWMLARAVGVPSSHGPVERVVGSLSDIHERRSLEHQLRTNALHDPLTGLPNRRLFLDRLKGAIALWKRSAIPFAVIFLDLDGFKTINDSLGHQMGDRVLSEVGARIMRELREVDTGARFGGDEFAILLHGTDPGGAIVVAERVRAALSKTMDLDGHECAMGASMGVTTSAVGYASAEDVLHDADTAMYRGKAAEPGSISFFDAAMHAKAELQQSLHTELQRALEETQFEVHYQPIVALETGFANRFEALVRWRHPERGLVMPDGFLPLMEEVGLIVPLGRWILDEVCRQLAVWGPRVVSVSVNISDREFWHQGLLGDVLDALRRHGLTADRLTLEITERVIMRRPEVALGIMREMHDAGLRLHIAAFGTGLGSGLDTLHRFPVDAFKIDRSFICGLASGDRGADLVAALVALGKGLGVAVVAEGVETGEQLAFLQGIGCATGQGYLFMPAVSGDRAADLLGCVLGSGHPDVVPAVVVTDPTSTATSVTASTSERNDSGPVEAKDTSSTTEVSPRSSSATGTTEVPPESWRHRL